MLCSFCSKSEPVRIDLKSVDLRICPACKATFFPAEHFPELRRCLVDATKIHWINVLSKCEEHIGANAHVLCLEHQTPLEKGIISGFSYEALVPKCCSLQHLTPSTMKQILNLILGINPTVRPKKGGIGRFLAGPIFHLFAKKAEEDEIDRLQYNVKFKNILEG